MQSYTLTSLLVTIRNDQAKDGQEYTFYTTTPPLISVRLISLFLASEKVKVLNHPPYFHVTSFYFQGLRKSFLEVSIRLEVLLAVLFVSVSNRYQKKRLFICFSRLVKKVTKMCFSIGGIL